MRKVLLTFLLLSISLTLTDALDRQGIRDILDPHLDEEAMFYKYNLTTDEFYAILDYAQDRYFNLTSEPRPGLVCRTCLASFKLLLSMRSEILLGLLEFIAVDYCWLSRTQDFTVCRGAVSAMTPIIASSLANHYLSPTRICPEIYLCNDYYKSLDLQTAINETLKDKPKRDDPKPTGRETMKLLHISDMHIDFDYAAGMEGDCGEPVCCEKMHGKAKSPASAAGRWGSLVYACDLPPETAIQALKFIEDEIKPDIAMWTGDNVDHTIWRQSREKNTYATIWVANQMKSIFNSTRMKVFPTDGNHECYPVNNFDFKSHREDSMKAAFSESWKDWIGQEAADSVKKNSYYSSIYEKYNLKVIGLETNACDDGNYFLLENPTDPGGMLAWLHQELLDSESKGQFVYVIGHIPADGCMDQWARRFEAIADRFNYTIRGHFFGHSHADLFRVLYAQDRQTPIGVQFVGASLTTYQDVHPSFRIFEIDVDTMLPVGFKQYRLNLTKYNAMENVDRLVWDQVYDVLTEYNLTDISPASMHLLRNRIKDDPVTAAKVMNNYNTDTTTGGNATNFYCKTLGIFTDRTACQSGQSPQDQAVGLMEKLTGPWIERVQHQAIIA